MKRWTDKHGTPHVSFDTVEEITPEALETVIADLYAPDTAATKPVPVVAEITLRQARETASALEKIAGGWPELSSQGFHDYLNDGAAAIYDLADAIEQMQRSLGELTVQVADAIHDIETTINKES